MGFGTTLFFFVMTTPLSAYFEDDVIAFVGRMNGTITYESVLGGDITIPDITVLSLIIETE